MDIRKIKKLIELLEESGIAELEIKEGEESVRISRQTSSVVQSVAPVAAPLAAPPAAAPVAATPPAASEQGNEWAPGQVTYGGNLLRSSLPNLGPFRNGGSTG